MLHSFDSSVTLAPSADMLIYNNNVKETQQQLCEGAEAELREQ